MNEMAAIIMCCSAVALVVAASAYYIGYTEGQRDGKAVNGGN